ncbi:MAG TPA: LysM peptidoglycan-binding domain-containing protein [Thermodesulfovibrionales bacterium]|nr:LysM peptidoglycan-binding domain-containing protein [Thermodesulfovibrionales bacterium]
MKKSCVALIFFVLLFIQPYTASADTTYTVRKGDNLSKISKKFRVDPERIQEANDMDPDQLMPGTRLVIPPRHSSSSRKEASSKTASSKTLIDTNQKDPYVQKIQYHTVKKGDSLSSLSKKYSVPLKDLKELNNIKKPKRLKPGQTLIVRKIGPKTYTVKKGDTISRIAKRFNISSDDIMEFNDLETEDLKPGQTLLLEALAEEADANSCPVPFEAAIAEDIKSLSESPELESLDLKERVILFAKKMLNIPYRFGGSSLMGIDCSGYVQKVFGFLNMTLPRSAREQFHVGETVAHGDLSIGDLVFFRTYASFPSHVGIYLGNNLFIHASSRGKKVKIDSLETPYYLKRFIGAKRLLTNDFEAEPETNRES